MLASSSPGGWGSAIRLGFQRDPQDTIGPTAPPERQAGGTPPSEKTAP